MQYCIEHDVTALQFLALGEALAELDPAALVDRQAGDGAVRISTFASTEEVIDACLRAQIDGAGVRRLPSECCGGCGG